MFAKQLLAAIRRVTPRITLSSIVRRRRRPASLRLEQLEPRYALTIVPLAPLAVNDVFAVGEDHVLVGNIIAGSATGGSDRSAVVGLPMAVVAVNGEPANHGVSRTLPTGAKLDMEGNGRFSYDPTTSLALSAIPSGQAVQDGFHYTLAPDFSNAFIFGDSLSDQGRLFAATGGLFPPDPPYYQGRVSNGPVWAETLAPHLDLELSAANNFAVAGAATGTANYNESILGTDLPGLADELQDFLTGLGGQPADPGALYVVWAGANDFFLPFDDPVAAIAQAVTNVATTIGTLQAVGAEHILVMNMPDMGLTPYALSTGQSASLTAISAGFNSALTSVLAGPGFQVAMVDVFGSIRQIVADPAAFGLTNVTDACFNGTTVTGNPDSYLFWDSVHPTAAGHRLIAEAVFSQLTTTATVAIHVVDSTTPPRLVVENHMDNRPGQLELRLSVVDASPADQTGSFIYTINWGDNSAPQIVSGSSSGTTITHDFVAGNFQRVSVQVTDQDGDSSPVVHEAVIWGTGQNDRFELTPYGSEKVRVRAAGRTLTVLPAEAIDRIVVFGLGGNDSISAAGLSAFVEFDGGAGNDLLVGSRTNDVLRGGPGNDILMGLDGNDSLTGGDGNDQLLGGRGRDILDGKAESNPIVGPNRNRWLGKLSRANRWL